MKFFVWPDGTRIEAREYDDVADSWRGDDFFIEIEDESEFDLKTKGSPGGSPPKKRDSAKSC